MTREQAIDLARRRALNSKDGHGYLPVTDADAAAWMPHEWVIDAIVAASQPPREPVQPLSDTVSVCKTDANNYCRILTALGMEEEGDPVAEVERLITERMSAGRAK